MSEVVNLRTVRKRKARDAARRDGTETAARLGEGAAEKRLRTAEEMREQRRLDGHRVEGHRDEGQGTRPDRPEER